MNESTAKCWFLFSGGMRRRSDSFATDSLLEGVSEELVVGAVFSESSFIGPSSSFLIAIFEGVVFFPPKRAGRNGMVLA